MVEGEEPEGKREQAEFISLVLMFRTSGLMGLGEIPDPVNQGEKIDLTQVQQSISFLEMIEQKTRGNLASMEEQILKDTLYELRMKYLQGMSHD